MKKIVAVVLVLVLLLLTGCQSAGQTTEKPEAIESPIPELEFGMTISQVKAALPDGCVLEEFATGHTTTLGLTAYPNKVYGCEFKVADLMFDQPYRYRGVESEPILVQIKLQLVSEDYDAVVKQVTNRLGEVTETLETYDPMALGHMKRVPSSMWSGIGDGIEAYDVSVQAIAAALSGQYFPITMKEGITEFRTDNIYSLEQVEEFGTLHFDGTAMERFREWEDYEVYKCGYFVVSDCTDSGVVHVSSYAGLPAYAELAQRCLEAE